MNNGVIKGIHSPYKEKRQLCEFGKYEELKENLVSSFEYCVKNEAGKACTRELYLKMLEKGPLVVAMDASIPGLSRYKPEGNFTPIVPDYCGPVNHAVVAVGFVTENGEEYLIVRNSWGVNWGRDGYFKIPANKACGIIDYAWLPNVQLHKPFPPSKCPIFSSKCNYEGQSVQTCYGVNDFDSAIGGSPQSYKNGGGLRIFMNLYKEKDCQGEPDWNYQDEIICFKDDFFYDTAEFKSASSDNISAPWGCIQHFSSPCYAAKRTLICDSIPDFNDITFKFTSGSLFAPKFQIKNIIFFDDIKYTGNGYGIKGNNLINLNDPKLIEIMTKAKSMIIFKREPNDKYDPDW
jgi:hypothetical protein